MSDAGQVLEGSPLAKWYREHGPKLRRRAVELAIVILALISLFGPPGRYVATVACAIALLSFEVLFSAQAEAMKPSHRSKTFAKEDICPELLALTDQRKLDIDAFGYTAETFFSIFDSFFQSLYRESHSLRLVAIRLLVRDLTKKSLIPCDDALQEDQGYNRESLLSHQKNLRQFRGSLKHHREELLGKVEIQFSIRTYAIEPFQKGMIIDNERAYWGLYPVKKECRDQEQIWDYDGQHAKMLYFSRFDQTAADAEAVRSLSEWFERTWTTFSCEETGSAHGNASVETAGRSPGI
jgi:hypothetical protein